VPGAVDHVRDVIVRDHAASGQCLRGDAVALPGLLELAERTSEEEPVGQQAEAFLRVEGLGVRDRAVNRIGDDGDHFHVVRLRPQHLVGRAELLRDQGAV
jgi:NADPH-dependent ferric siderophore reductase